MQFRLVLRGTLPPEKRGNIDVKHRIRRELHPQLRTLWKEHGLLRNAWRPGPDGRLRIEAVADEYEKFGFRFVPLVRKGFACSLEVLILRRDEPFKVFGAGDLDGRVKTLLDGLRLPQQRSELAANTPAEGENPFFCLLEDDSYIHNIEVRTDRLLVPPEPDEPHRDAVVVIGVHVRYALGADLAVFADVSLY